MEKDLKVLQVLDHYCSICNDGRIDVMTLDKLKTSNEFRIVVGEESQLQSLKDYMMSTDDEKMRFVWGKMETTPMDEIGLPEMFGDTIQIYSVEWAGTKLAITDVTITRNTEDAESVKS